MMVTTSILITDQYDIYLCTCSYIAVDLIPDLHTITKSHSCYHLHPCYGRRFDGHSCIGAYG